jgi:hypothetical protein
MAWLTLIWPRKDLRLYRLIGILELHQMHNHFSGIHAERALALSCKHFYCAHIISQRAGVHHIAARCTWRTPTWQGSDSELWALVNVKYVNRSAQHFYNVAKFSKCCQKCLHQFSSAVNSYTVFNLLFIHFFWFLRCLYDVSGTGRTDRQRNARIIARKMYVLWRRNVRFGVRLCGKLIRGRILQNPIALLRPGIGISSMSQLPHHHKHSTIHHNS